MTATREVACEFCGAGTPDPTCQACQGTGTQPLYDDPNPFDEEPQARAYEQMFGWREVSHYADKHGV